MTTRARGVALTATAARGGEAAPAFCGGLPWGGYGGSVPGVQGGRPPAANSKIYSVMLNFLRPFFARLFGPVVQGLARTPVTPNMITVAGTVGVSAATLAMFPIGWLFPGAATATVFTFTDMLDGQLARIKGSSGRYGAFLDSTMDRLGDAAVFGGI